MDKRQSIFINLTGQVFGRLTVKNKTKKPNKNGIFWYCECSCGGSTTTTSYNLTHGLSKSCGCFQREWHLRKATTCKLDDGSFIIRGSNFKDITNQRFNYLIAKRPIRKSKNNGLIIWLCICDCTNETEVAGADLRRGSIISCGCRATEAVSKANSTHGKSKSAEYKIWAYIKYRCENKRCRDYKNYGGRGIVIDWQTFEEFYSDMGPRPTSKHSIERKDNDGPYSKENCIWGTVREQNRNKRKTIYLVHNGKKKPLVQWAEELHLDSTLLYSRHRMGWGDEKTITEKVHIKHWKDKPF